MFGSNLVEINKIKASVLNYGPSDITMSPKPTIWFVLCVLKVGFMSVPNSVPYFISNCVAIQVRLNLTNQCFDAWGLVAELFVFCVGLGLITVKRGPVAPGHSFTLSSGPQSKPLCSPLFSCCIYEASLWMYLERKSPNENLLSLADYICWTNGSAEMSAVVFVCVVVAQIFISPLTCTEL